jgi:ribosomal protein S21
VVEVKSKKNESFESLLRRFTRRLQSSGNALEARKMRFNKPEPNKNAQRKSALRREVIRVKREYLTRIGQLIEEPRGAKRRN